MFPLSHHPGAAGRTASARAACWYQHPNLFLAPALPCTLIVSFLCDATLTAIRAIPGAACAEFRECVPRRERAVQAQEQGSQGRCVCRARDLSQRGARPCVRGAWNMCLDVSQRCAAFARGAWDRFLDTSYTKCKEGERVREEGGCVFVMCLQNIASHGK